MPNKKKSSLSKKPSNKKGKSKFSTLKYNFIGLIFLSLSLLVLILPSLIPMPTPKPSSINPIVISKTLLSSVNLNNIPQRIIIPKSNIDISVIPAKIVNGYWELSDNTASYGLGSGIPGQKNNTVIFAHARVGLFYNLKNVSLGDTVYVFTKNKWYRYKVNKITAVYPNQIQVIEPTKNETLTLYTCTGFYDEKRLIVTAIPQS